MLEHFFNERDGIYDLKKITLLFLILLLTLATIFQKKRCLRYFLPHLLEKGGLHMNSCIEDAFRGGLSYNFPSCVPKFLNSDLLILRFSCSKFLLKYSKSMIILPGKSR